MSTRKAFVEPYVDLWLALFQMTMALRFQCQFLDQPLRSRSLLNRTGKIKFIPGPSSAEIDRYPSFQDGNSLEPEVVL